MRSCRRFTWLAWCGKLSGMTVQELINELIELPLDAVVRVLDRGKAQEDSDMPLPAVESVNPDVDGRSVVITY
jgi:hypothetical protein